MSLPSMTKLLQNIKIANGLNIDIDQSSMGLHELLTAENVNNESYIISVADEELLILIEFKQIVNLFCIKLYALSMDNDQMNVSPPKQIHIYKLDNLNKNFHDIQSMKPDKSIKCSINKLKNGQRINLQKTAKNAVQFKNTKYLAIYIETNQNQTKNTYLNGIHCIGIQNEEYVVQPISSSKTFNRFHDPNNRIIATTDYTQVNKKRQFKPKLQRVMFDKTDKENRKQFHELFNDFNDNEISMIDSSHLLNPHRTRDPNNQKQIRCIYDEEVVNNLVSLGVASRDQCIRASENTMDYKNPNAVLETIEQMNDKQIIPSNKQSTNTTNKCMNIFTNNENI